MDFNYICRNAVTLDDGSRYVEVKFRNKAFRMDYKDGRTETFLEFVNDRTAVAKALVYDGDRQMAEAYGMRIWTETAPNYIESAETVALGRALSDIGYNLFTSDVMMNGQTFKNQKIRLDDGSMYLNVGFRVAWFKSKHPEALIKKEIVRYENSFAVMKATVLNKNGKILVEAHARRDFMDNEEGGRYFLETAETAAVGRALNLMGYDLPPEENADTMGEYQHFMADMPVRRNTNQSLPPFNGRGAGAGPLAVIIDYPCRLQGYTLKNVLEQGGENGYQMLQELLKYDISDELRAAILGISD